MEWLNYHHLYYFSVIAEAGGVAPAARKLRLTHSTLSAQLRALEEHFGAALFERRGKRLVLTSFGSDAASYAADIFRLGRELSDFARHGGASRNALRVGIVSGIPKTLAQHLLAHRLGETEILLFAGARLARRAKRDFPKGLSAMPFVLPPPGAPLRRELDAWFAKHRIEVQVKAEADDAGLLRALGSAERGVFPVRSALTAELEDLRDISEVGRCEGVRETYYAVTAERRVRHAGVVAIIEHARVDLAALPMPRRQSAP
jgi:LysR family transcriptional regulator, transcriptional activator of nhaA